PRNSFRRLRGGTRNARLPVQREIRKVWLRLAQHAREGRARREPRKIGRNMPGLAERLDEFAVEERRCRGTIGERELFTSGPRPRCDFAVEEGIGFAQLRLRLFDAKGIALVLG